MKSVGIVCEYNPLHNGHIFHINSSKQITGADVVICVMSGNFVQRGEPAIIDKYIRAKAAINSGADIVVELPVYASLSSAEGFAQKSVLILSALKTDYICFGSESGDLQALYSVAKTTVSEDELLSSTIKQQLSNGLSYPASLSYALNKLYSIPSEITGNPNNTLGIEYLKTIINNNLDIIPFTIKREGAGYHDTAIDKYMSATGIRKLITSQNDCDIAAQKQYLPEYLYSLLSHNCIYPVTIDDFSLLFNYRMSEICNLSSTKKEAIDLLRSYPDISEDLANRILSCYSKPLLISDFIENVKTKNITYSRISRAIMKIILGITEEDNCSYIRILGLSKNGCEYLKKKKNKINYPIITKVADSKELLKKEIHYNTIYNQIVYEKYNIQLKDEFRAGIYIKD